MKKFTLKHQFLPTSKSRVLATIVDFEDFAKFHPVMDSAKLVARPSATEAIYDVKESVKFFGWLPMHPRYKVLVKCEEDQIVQTAHVMGLMRLRIVLSFTQEGETCWLLENLEVSNIPLLTSLFWKIFSQAHKAAFSKLRQHIEGNVEP